MISLTDITEPFTGEVPGCAIAVIQNGEPILIETHGCADMESKMPVTAQTNFRLASVSKQFTAAAILELHSRGKLMLEDTIGHFFPDFSGYGGDITVYQLLTHTSGLISYEELMKPGRTKQVHDAEILELLSKCDHGYFPPGSAFRYSDSGYCLLALIVERVSGNTFGEFLRSELFLPLGMTNTFVNEEGSTLIPNRAYGYSKNVEWVRTDQNVTSATMGDGGIYSSIEDLVKWSASLDARSLFDKHVLTDQKPAPIHYGFGFFLKEYRGLQVQYHGGSSIGFKTALYRVPEKKITILFLSNRGEGDGPALCEAVLDHALSAI